MAAKVLIFVKFDPIAGYNTPEERDMLFKNTRDFISEYSKENPWHLEFIQKSKICPIFEMILLRMNRFQKYREIKEEGVIGLYKFFLA